MEPNINQRKRSRILNNRTRWIKINKEEFEKKHPSLKGKIDVYFLKERIPKPNSYLNEGGFYIDAKTKDIHETQLDKEKVRKAIKTSFINFPAVTKDQCIRELEKELRLNIKQTYEVDKK